MARSWTTNITNALVSSAMPTALQSFSGAFTIAIWCNPTIVATNTHPLGFGDGSFAARGAGLLPTGSLGNTNKWGGVFSNIAFVDSGQTLTGGVWAHLAFTRAASGSSAWALFNNGVQAATGTSTMNATNNTTDRVQILQADTSLMQYADYAIWTVALTTAEILALANGARPYQIRPASLVSWYPLNGLTSPEPSMDGSGITGTLIGASLATGPAQMQFTPRWPIKLGSDPAASATTIILPGQFTTSFAQRVSAVGY